MGYDCEEGECHTTDYLSGCILELNLLIKKLALCVIFGHRMSPELRKEVDMALGKGWENV
jgi:hypothetical protein